MVSRALTKDPSLEKVSRELVREYSHLECGGWRSPGDLGAEEPFEWLEAEFDFAVGVMEASHSELQNPRFQEVSWDCSSGNE